MGKKKGSAFERSCAKYLSKWWTKGEKEKALWRADNRGGITSYVADIAPMDSEAENFPFAVECKDSKSWSWKGLAVPLEERNCTIIEWWEYLKEEIDEKQFWLDEDPLPILMFTKSYENIYIATNKETYKLLNEFYGNVHLVIHREEDIDDLYIIERDNLFNELEPDEVEEIRYD